MKGFMKKIFGSKPNPHGSQESKQFLVATLNDRILPVPRHEVYAQPLDAVLDSLKIGEVTGGGTMQFKTGEIERCDLEIKLNDGVLPNKEVLDAITKELEKSGAPKGSMLHGESMTDPVMFGQKEGMAVYLDGANLPEEVYEKCDSNYVLFQLKSLIGDVTETLRYWEGPTETAFYFYGDSFETMQKAITNFINEYPLCKGARVEQIA